MQLRRWNSVQHSKKVCLEDERACDGQANKRFRNGVSMRPREEADNL